jgi:starch phosphorylase
MALIPGAVLAHVIEGVTFRFCSQLCLRTFVADPVRYGAGRRAASGDEEAARRIAYFSMEVAVDPRMPTYSGGLGVLAGDALRSCADLRIPVVGVSLLYPRGYFLQQLDAKGSQRELPVEWNPTEHARLRHETVSVTVEGRTVFLRAWQHEIRGTSGFSVPLLLLDSSSDQNAPPDRELSACLYGGDERYRLAQEILLGVGGLRMLRKLGYTRLERFHMNEGHAALLALELLRETRGSGVEWDFATVRAQCVFTTHTPVPAGHDQFPYALVERVLGDDFSVELLRMLGGSDRLNMTLLAMNLSQYVNGVARKHGEVSRQMFPSQPIEAITNGVHSRTWTHPSFAKLYDRFIPGWEADPFLLRNAARIPGQEIWDAHVEAKRGLVAAVQARTGETLSQDAFTIGFARRAALYKRLYLIFEEPGRLRRMVREGKPIQLVLAGKAHPRDEQGKELVRLAHDKARELRGAVQVVYLPNYDMELARVLTAGADLWLNTPIPPQEASGTSGMKAAHNGVPSLSVLDGWWVEGHIEGMTGWSIGREAEGHRGVQQRDREDAADLYDKLEHVIVPLYYRERSRWIEIMRETICLNASFFHAHRMMLQYAANAYLR